MMGTTSVYGQPQPQPPTTQPPIGHGRMPLGSQPGVNTVNNVNQQFGGMNISGRPSAPPTPAQPHGHGHMPAPVSAPAALDSDSQSLLASLRTLFGNIEGYYSTLPERNQLPRMKSGIDALQNALANGVISAPVKQYLMAIAQAINSADLITADSHMDTIAAQNYPGMDVWTGAVSSLLKLSRRAYSM